MVARRCRSPREFPAGECEMVLVLVFINNTAIRALSDKGEHQHLFALRRPDPDGGNLVKWE